jgi:putative NADH-flavin reductase
MKKIILFGASGGTGKLVIEQALIAGHQITAIVRNPEDIDLKHQNLEIIKGDIFKISTFENAMKNKDLVVSCLGVQKNSPTTVYSVGIKNIINMMQHHSLNRIICLSAGAVIVPPKGSFMTKFFIKNILQKIYKNLYSDMLLMEEILKSTTMNYIIIRPPWLRNSKFTGIYRTAINEHLDNPTKISRADLADFIVNQISDTKTFKSIIELSY